MPELPEVETIRLSLDRTVIGHTITAISGSKPTIDPGNLPPVSGRKIAGTARHGKFLFADLDSGSSLVFHFGMTGNLTLVPGDEPDPPYSRAEIFFDDHARLAFTDPRRFGRLGWAPDRAAFIAGRRLGPDALTISRERFLADAAGTGRRAKLFLLDQNRIAGIGNIYADEILFAAGIHPHSVLQECDPVRLSLIATAVPYVLNSAVDHAADFGKFPETWIIPYRACGESCPCCSSPIDRVVVAGRYAYFCPFCQR